MMIGQIGLMKVNDLLRKNNNYERFYGQFLGFALGGFLKTSSIREELIQKNEAKWIIDAKTGKRTFDTSYKCAK